jgi:uncharacterized protein YueI
MSPTARSEYLKAIKERYRHASRFEKKSILDEFCTICHYNRKYAIRLLNSPSLTNRKINLSKRGRKKEYDDPMILEVLRQLWTKTNLPCSKRLKTILLLWLPFYPNELPDEVRKKVMNISPATIDRLMATMRSGYLKQGLCTTKPGSLLKKHIPIKTNQWDENQPGFLEADAVAHCGSSAAGMFAYTINCVDIATTWTEQRAVWGKGETGVRNAVGSIENHLPFPLKGFDCDNGSEFLNWHLLRYFSKRKIPVQFTRAREYHKNDNAHIEEKNWSIVRLYLGYQRFDKEQLVEKLNDLYINEWNDYFNFFIPSVKLVEKYRNGSKIIKKYDAPKTPFQRILESQYVPEETKICLQKHFNNLNPFELQKQMTQKIKTIIHEVNK